MDEERHESPALRLEADSAREPASTGDALTGGAVDVAGMQRLFALFARLATETDLDAALHEILAAAVAVANTDRGTLHLASDDSQRLETAARHGYPAGSTFPESFLTHPSELASHVLRRGRQRTVIDDVATFPALAGTRDREAALADGVRAITCTPLVTRAGEGVGVLCTQFRAPHQPAPGELRMIDLLAGTAAEFVERHHAEAALRNGQRRMRAQTEALQATVNGASLEASLGIVSRMVVEETQGEARTAFYVADPDGTCLHPVRGAGTMPPAYLAQVDGFIIGEDSLACALAVPTGRPVLAADVRDDPLWAPWLHMAEAFDYRACWSFPIKTRDDKAVGTFAMYFRAPREPTARDLALAEVAARTAAVIIAGDTEARDRERAESALRASEERYRMLFESMDEAYAVVEVMRDESGRWSDFLFLDANPAFMAHTGMPYPVGRTSTDLLGTPNPRWAEIYGRVAETGVSVRTEEAETTLGRVFDLNIFRLGGAGSRRVAVLFTNVTARKQTEAALLELNETLERRVEERTREVRRQEERFRALVDTAALLVWAADADGRVVEDSPPWRAVTGQTREEWLAEGWLGAVHPADRMQATREWLACVRTGEPLNAEFRLWHARSRGWRWTNARAVRLPDGARGWIGMNIDIDGRRQAEEARSEVLRQLVTTEDEERRRISRELHDSLGQLVTGLLLGLRTLPRGGEASRIADLERLADRIAREMQHMAVQLRPPALDNLGLRLALQAHMEEWSHRYGVESDFHTVGLDGERFPAEVETTLYRVVQEGLNNVVKHAGATRAGLVLEWRNGVVSAILEDDGRGFEADTLSSPEKARRLGLRGMRERVALMGGELEIESSRGVGTTLYVRLPVAAQDAS